MFHKTDAYGAFLDPKSIDNVYVTTSTSQHVALK